MAKEYIDKSKALNIYFPLRVKAGESRGQIARRAVQEYADRIEAIPAADVVEVQHGHWIRREGFDYENNVILGACSKCDWGVKDFTNYCPNCGAKMEGVDDGQP